jgi:hypothetical protein
VRDTESGRLLHQAAANAGAVKNASVRAVLIAAEKSLTF